MRTPRKRSMQYLFVHLQQVREPAAGIQVDGQPERRAIALVDECWSTGRTWHGRRALGHRPITTYYVALPDGPSGFNNPGAKTPPGKFAGSAIIGPGRRKRNFFCDRCEIGPKWSKLLLTKILRSVDSSMRIEQRLICSAPCCAARPRCRQCGYGRKGRVQTRSLVEEPGPRSDRGAFLDPVKRLERLIVHPGMAAEGEIDFGTAPARCQSPRPPDRPSAKGRTLPRFTMRARNIP